MTKDPWLSEGSPWETCSDFITWIRGGLRRHWSVHPIKLNYLKSKKKRIVNPNKKTITRYPYVNGWSCEICGGDFLKVQVDHVSEEFAKFTNIEDIESYAKHLYFVSYSDLQLCCKKCHDCITHSQRKGVSFEEAAMLKEVIRIFKEESLESILDFIAAHDYNDEYAVNNAVNRKAAVRMILEAV